MNNPNNKEDKTSDSYRYAHNLMSDEERIKYVYSCSELPASPYSMRNPNPPTQKQLDDTEREYQRIKKMKEERIAIVEAEMLRREQIQYRCQKCGSRMQHNGVRNHQVRWRCPNCGATKKVGV